MESRKIRNDIGEEPQQWQKSGNVPLIVSQSSESTQTPSNFSRLDHDRDQISDTGCNSHSRENNTIAVLLQASVHKQQLNTSTAGKSISVIPPSIAERPPAHCDSRSYLSLSPSVQYPHQKYRSLSSQQYPAYDESLNTHRWHESAPSPGYRFQGSEMGSLPTSRPKKFLEYLESGSQQYCCHIHNPNAECTREPAYGFGYGTVETASGRVSLTPIPPATSRNVNDSRRSDSLPIPPTSSASGGIAMDIDGQCSNFGTAASDSARTHSGAQTQPGAWDSLDYIDRKGGMGGDGVSQDAQGTLSTSSSQPSRERKRKSRKRGGDAMDTPGSFTTPDVRWDLKAEVKVHLTDMGGSTTQMRRWACFPLLLQPTKKPATTPVEDRAVEVQEFCESFGKQYTEKRSFDKGVDTGMKKGNSGRGSAKSGDADAADTGKASKPRRKAVMYIGGGKNSPSAAKVEESRIAAGLYRYQYFARKDPEDAGAHAQSEQSHRRDYDHAAQHSPYHIHSSSASLFPQGSVHASMYSNPGMAPYMLAQLPEPRQHGSHPSSTPNMHYFQPFPPHS